MIAVPFRTVSFVLFVSTASGAFAAAPQEDLVARWLRETSFGLPVTIGSSRYEPSTQSVVLENVAIGGEKDWIRIGYGKMTVEDPRLTPSGDFAAHSLRADTLSARVTVDFEAWFPEIAEMQRKKKAAEQQAGEQETPDANGKTTGNDKSASGSDGAATATAEVPPRFEVIVESETSLVERPVTPISAPKLAADARPLDKLLAFARWNVGAQADWVEYANLTVTFDGLPDQGATTYERVYASGINDGRAERYGASNMVQRSTDPANPLKSYTVGSMSAHGLDMGAYLDVLDPAAYVGGKGDGKWRAVLQEEVDEDISFEFDGGTFGIDRILTIGVHVRQTEKPIFGLIAAAIADPTSIERDPVAFLREMVPNIAGMGRLDHMAFEGMRFTAPEGVEGSIGRVAMDQASADGVGALLFEDMTVKAGEKGGGSLDLLSFTDMKFGSLIAFIDLAEASKDGKQPSPELVRRAVFEGSPTLGFLEVAGLTVDTPQGSLGLGNVAVTSGDFLQALARRMDLTVTGFTMPVSMITDEAARKQLTDLGYEKIDASGAMTFTWDTDKGDLRLEDVTLKAADVGVLSADVHLGNMPLSLFDDPTQIETKMQDVTLVDAALAFGNQSVVERVFEMQAKPLNQDPVAFRKNFGNALPLMLGFLGDKALQDRLAAPLKEFLVDPQSVKAAVKPAAPVPMSAFETLQGQPPAKVLDLLQLDVRANE